MIPPAAPIRLAAVLAMLLFVVSHGALGQTNASPPAGVLIAPGKHKPVPEVKPTAPAAAPKPVVQQGKAAEKVGMPPVVRPQGPLHPKPAKKPLHSDKAAAKPGAAAAPPPPAAVATAPPEAPVEIAKGSSTGMNLPRFAALRSDEVNLRAGPGTRYPIDWVYKRRDLPVRIEREFEVWRLVADPDGIKGWVHQATLTGRRSFVVTGVERSLRRQAAADSAPVAMLMPGVVGQIRSCDAAAEWCQLQVGDFRGWLKRDEFWGALPGEAIK